MYTHTHTHIYRNSLVAQLVKNLPTMLETWVWSLEKGMPTHSSIIAWSIPGTEEPSGLLSMGLKRVRHTFINTHTHTHIHTQTTHVCIFFFRLFSLIGYYKILSIVPCARVGSFLVTCVIYSSVYLLIPNSQFIPLIPPSPFITVNLFSVTVGLFLLFKLLILC